MTDFFISWAIVLAVAGIAIGGAEWHGHSRGVRDEDAKYAARSLSALESHLQYIQGQQAKLDKAEAALEKAKNEQRIEFRTITQNVDKIVDRPVYRNVCLDADGILLVNQAISGLARPAIDPSQPAAALSDTSPH